MPFTTRFAPSPSGYLHLGHAYSAILAHDAARNAPGGRFILRIEDIDETRCRPEFERAIYEDLEWLGLAWDGPALRQSEHLAEYRSVIKEWAALGLVYRCFKTRKEVAEAIASAPHCEVDSPRNETGRNETGSVFVGVPLPLDQEQSLLESGAPFAWRLSLAACKQHLGQAFDALEFRVASKNEQNDGGETVPSQKTRTGQSFSQIDFGSSDVQKLKAEPERFGDVVIGRKEGGVSYHLASTMDDQRQGITHIIRGDDLSEAPHCHALLLALLGAQPPVYYHHKLIKDETGNRLAKRDKAATLQSLRASGVTPAEVRARLGLDATVRSISEIR